MSEQGDGSGGRDAVGWLKRIADGGAMAFVPLTRTRFGEEGIGVAGGVGCLMILLAVGTTGSLPLLAYFVVWLLAVIRQRIKTVKLVRQGWVEHSRYTGWPWLIFRLSPFIKNELAAKQVGEPLLCLLIGIVLAEVPGCEPLALFILFCGACIFVSTGIDIHIDRMRLRRMRDMEIEQRQMAEWHRNGGMY